MSRSYSPCVRHKTELCLAMEIGDLLLFMSHSASSDRSNLPPRTTPRPWPQPFPEISVPPLAVVFSSDSPAARYQAARQPACLPRDVHAARNRPSLTVPPTTGFFLGVRSNTPFPTSLLQSDCSCPPPSFLCHLLSDALPPRPSQPDTSSQYRASSVSRPLSGVTTMRVCVYVFTYSFACLSSVSAHQGVGGRSLDPVRSP